MTIMTVTSDNSDSNDNDDNNDIITINFSPLNDNKYIRIVSKKQN